MVDTFTREERRAIMQAVRRERTRPEEVLVNLLRAEGIRFRRNVKTLPGKPDVFFPQSRLALFVHGCFWHGHPRCRKGQVRPKTNKTYWNDKILRNRRRDLRVSRALRAAGLSVYTIWECELVCNRLPKRLIVRLRHLRPSQGRETATSGRAHTPAKRIR